MKTKRCLNCGCKFYLNERILNQKFCSKKECQGVRRNRWLKHKIKHDVDYKQSRIVSQNKWTAKKHWQPETKEIDTSKPSVSSLMSKPYNYKHQKLNIAITVDLLAQLIRKKAINCKIVLV